MHPTLHRIRRVVLNIQAMRCIDLILRLDVLWIDFVHSLGLMLLGHESFFGLMGMGDGGRGTGTGNAKYRERAGVYCGVSEAFRCREANLLPVAKFIGNGLFIKRLGQVDLPGAPLYIAHPT